MASLVALTCALLCSCGGGGGGHSFVYTGFVDVHNESYSTDVVGAVDFFGRSGSPNYFFDTSLFPGESLFVELRSGFYDVEVYWDSGAVHTFFDVRVFTNSTTFIDVAR